MKRWFNFGLLLIPATERYLSVKKDIDLAFSSIIVEAFAFLFN